LLLAGRRQQSVPPDAGFWLLALAARAGTVIGYLIQDALVVARLAIILYLIAIGQTGLVDQRVKKTGTPFEGRYRWLGTRGISMVHLVGFIAQPNSIVIQNASLT